MSKKNSRLMMICTWGDTDWQFHNEHLWIFCWICGVIPVGVEIGSSFGCLLASVNYPRTLVRAHTHRPHQENACCQSESSHYCWASSLLHPNCLFLCCRATNSHCIFKCIGDNSEIGTTDGYGQGACNRCQWHHFCNLGFHGLVWQWACHQAWHWEWKNHFHWTCCVDGRPVSVQILQD